MGTCSNVDQHYAGLRIFYITGKTTYLFVGKFIWEILVYFYELRIKLTQRAYKEFGEWHRLDPDDGVWASELCFH